MQTFDLCVGTGHPIVGKVSLDENPASFSVQAGVERFRLTLPATIQLYWQNASLPRPVIAGLSCQVFSSGTARDVFLGSATDPLWYLPAKGGQQFSANLVWEGDLRALAWLEKQRSGGAPKLKLRIEALLAKAIPGVGADDWPHEVCTVPHPCFCTLVVKYPVPAWTAMIRTLGVAESVLVEIPVPGARPAPWDTVFKYLSEAREALEKGGTTGWKGCVVAVREGLTTWQKFEPEDKGAGITVDRQLIHTRTKEQRLDCLRWNLLQAAHLAPHSPAENWTRDDAVLLLSAFAGLLAERNP
jgi:hypothetical protein